MSAPFTQELGILSRSVRCPELERARRALERKRIALVHDWLVTFAGSERVLAELAGLFPRADCFALIDFLPGQDRSFLNGRPVKTTFLQRLPWMRKHYRKFLPLMPLAVETLDMSGYDLVISSAHAVCKGVLTGPGQLHFCYCHTPPRYAWDLQGEYLRDSGMGPLGRVAASFLLQYLRLWDRLAADRVDHFIANSAFVAGRIKRIYRRNASVVYPPVDTEYFTPAGERGDYYLTACRLVPYKRVDLAVRAFSRMRSRRLVVTGAGPEQDKLQKLAGSNVILAGEVSRAELREWMRGARGFIHAACEDFGIAMAEAQACGTPVVAYGRGGAAEIVRPGTGVLFPEQSEEALAEAIDVLESQQADLDPARIRSNALRFSRETFAARILGEIAARLGEP